MEICNAFVFFVYQALCKLLITMTTTTTMMTMTGYV